MRDWVIFGIEGRRHTLQLESHTSSARPRTVLQGAVATDFAFAASIARSHDLQSLVPVVLVDKDILFGVGGSGGRGGFSHVGEIRKVKSSLEGSGSAPIEGYRLEG